MATSFSHINRSFILINFLCFLLVTEEELELAFQMKKFSVCDSLQETIRDIQFARSKLPLPEVTPTSRKELDLMLLEAKYTLDHTVAVHDLVLCGKLELRIQQLESHKSTYLTVEERQVSFLTSDYPPHVLLHSLAYLRSYFP